LLLSGFLSIDYARHDYACDYGPTVGLRIGTIAPDTPHAYHLVAPTLNCAGKRGLVLHQQQGCAILQTSSLNQRSPDPDHASLDMGFVQKTNVLTVSDGSVNLLEDIVYFAHFREILELVLTFHKELVLRSHQNTFP